MPASKKARLECDRDEAAAKRIEASTCMAKMLGSHEGKEELKRFQQPAEDSTDRVAAFHTLKALDHMLDSSGLGGLAGFGSRGVPAGMLPAHQFRYFVDTPQWASYEVPTSTPWRRSCVKDKQTKEKRFELEFDDDDEQALEPPLLVLIPDESSVNLSALHFLLGGLSARAIWIRDPYHRQWRDFSLACREASLWGSVLELIHCINLPFGPWRSEAWWSTLRGSLNTYLKRSDENDALFQSLWPQMADDLQDRLTTERGSDRQQKEVFKILCGAEMFQSKGRRVALCRWFGFYVALKDFLPKFHMFLLALCVLLRDKGVYRSILDMPIWGVPRKVELDDPKGAGDKDAKLDDKQKMEKMRAKCVNALHLGASILGSPGIQRKARIMLVVGEPLHNSFSKEARNLKSAKQVVKYYVAFAKFGAGYVCRKLFGKLGSIADLERMSFDMETGTAKYDEGRAIAGSSNGPCAAHDPPKLTLGDASDEDMEMAQIAWVLACRSAKHRSLNMSHFCENMPGKLALLASDSPATHAEGLAFAKMAWTVFCEAEKRRHSSAAVMKLVKAVNWFHWVVPVEILIQLAQHDFMIVPAPTLSMIDTMYESWGQTAIVENGFNAAKNAARRGRNSRLKRLKRWYQPHIKSIMTERFQRPEVQPSSAPLSSDVPRRIPKAFLEAAVGQATVGDEKLSRILASQRNPWYPTTDAQGMHSSCAAFRLLRQCAEGDCWTRVADAWKSILPLPDTIVQNKVSGEVLVVLWPSSHGFLAWPADRVKLNVGDFYAFTPRTEGKAKSSWHVIFDFDDWQSIPTKIAPPRVVQGVLGAAAGSSRISALQTGPPCSLVEAAARVAFRGCTSFHLDCLLRELNLLGGVPKEDRPKGVFAKVLMLVRALLPDLTDSEVVAIMQARIAHGKQAASGSLLEGDNMAQADGCIDPSDMKAAKGFREEVTTKHKVLAAMLYQFLLEKKLVSGDTIPTNVKEMGMESKEAKAVTKAIKDTKRASLKTVWSWSEKNLKSKMPKIKGCTLQQVVNEHTTCWVARYPSTLPGCFGSRTRKYGGKVSSDACAKHVFSWAWSMHQLHGGEACPYEIDGFELEAA